MTQVPDQSAKQLIKPVLSIDAKGLACPLPLLKAKQGLHNISAGECVEILATDAGSVRDFHTFVELSAHVMVSFQEIDNCFQYIIEKRDT